MRVPASLTRGQCGMRKVLIAIAVLIVLVWLIPWDLEPEGEIQVPPPVSPVVATPESRSTIRANDARAIVAPESVPDVAEPSAPSPQAPATTTAMSVRMWGDAGLDGPVASHFQQKENEIGRAACRGGGRGGVGGGGVRTRQGG